MLRIEACRPGRIFNWILVAASAGACASPTRHFVSDGGDESSAGKSSTTNGGQFVGTAGRNSTNAATAGSGTPSGAPALGGATSVAMSNASGNPPTSSPGGSPANAGASGQSTPLIGGSANASGGASTLRADTGGSSANTIGGVANGGTNPAGGVPSSGGTTLAFGGSGTAIAFGGSATAAGTPGALAGAPASTGGTLANGGSVATGGMGTGGAPPLLVNGLACSHDSECQSANCRVAPNAMRYCVAAGNACASSTGSGVAAATRFCEGAVSETCTATDTIAAEDCAVVAVCQAGICDPGNGSSCRMAPANQGALCPNGGGTGACDDGVCAPLRFVPPGPAIWTYLNSGPANNVPANCGTSSNPPCAIGDFRFVWPPDTGQTKCYGDSAEVSCPGQPGGATCASTAFCGQDGQYGVDVTRPSWNSGRFTQSGAVGSDVVTDSLTGIVWTVSSQTASKMPWATAQQFCGNKSGSAYAGRSDWKLPGVYQLFSLYDFGLNTSAQISTAFPGMTAFYHWSSSTSASDTNATWIASTSLPSYVTAENRTTPSSETLFGVRCVSLDATVATATARFYATGNATERVIFDTRTGLLWQQSPDSTPRNWKDVLSYCEGSTYGGRSDWRVPSVVELESIVDYSRSNPACDPLAFPDTPGVFFWTSTTQANSPTNAWAISFNQGTLALWSSGKGTNVNPVRCVAAGPT